MRHHPGLCHTLCTPLGYTTPYAHPWAIPTVIHHPGLYPPSYTTLGYTTPLGPPGLYHTLRTSWAILGHIHHPGLYWAIYTTLGYTPPYTPGIPHHPTQCHSVPSARCSTDGCTGREPWALTRRNPWVGEALAPRVLKSVSVGRKRRAELLRFREKKEGKIG